MRDYLFFNFLFENYIEYALYTFIFAVTIYFLCRRVVGYILDPFHFYYTFTFSTSYAVIFLLYMHDYVLNDYFFYLLLSNFFFFIFYVAFSKGLNSKGFFFKLCYSISNDERFMLRLLILVYMGMLTFYLSQVSLTSLFTSRFEANKGLGMIVRVMDALRLIIAAWLYLYFIRYGSKRSLIFAIIFSIVATLFSGAKFALLEQMYVMFVAGFVGERSKIKLNIKTLIPGVMLLFVLSLIVVNLILKMSSGIGYTESQYMPGTPVALELFIIRIIANGDSYYLSLTERVLDSISINSPVLQFLSNTFGNSVMSNVFNADFSNGDIGRQIWLYWYPDDEVMRGPTAHFDIAGFVYFGYVGGAIFSAIIGAWLGVINKWKFSCFKAPALVVAFVSAIYCRSLPLMLNPSVGFAYIVDIFFLLFVLLVVSTLCRKGMSS